MANYLVNPEVLKPYLPHGTEIDTWQGRCYISLVGFMFENTRLLGIRVPWHSRFEEVNLRFYVKRKEGEEWKRGVVFIKEIVPRYALSFVANTVYNERYETLKMDHHWIAAADRMEVMYKWKKKGQWQEFRVKAGSRTLAAEPNSEEEFITEHYWGYARVSARKTNEYEVTHPRWELYPVREYEIDIDFGKVYGEEFAFLNQENPVSVMLAEGSEITVEKKRRLSQ